MVGIRRFSKVAVFAVCVAALSVSACSRDASTKVAVKGSTTVLPIIQKAAEEFHASKKISVSVSGTGSGDGIKSIIEGNCDIAMSSREMKAAELEKAKSKGARITEIAIAYDMIVPVVNPKNQVANLTLDQLKAIYDGSVSTWNLVGGNKDNIVVVSRDTSSGTFEVWEGKVMKKADVRKDALLQASNGAVGSAITSNPKAIGYVGFGYLNSSLKTLTVNGVEPTLENGKTGKYPISRKLYLYINENKLSAEAKSFVDFILSPDGQKLVKEAGFIQL
jgi:phosphate transport system substrate-binding protein